MKVKILEATGFSKRLVTKNNLRLEYWAQKIDISIHTNSNHADSNQESLTKLPIIGPNIDSADFLAIQKILSWNRNSMDTASSTFSKRKPTYTSSINTPSLLHSLQL